jgi:hypothetical protein
MERFQLQPVSPHARGGSWQISNSEAHFDGAGFGWCSLGQVGDTAVLEVTVDLRYSAEEVGVALRATPDFGAAYLLRLV